jgi:FkbM family methyltransferase
MTASAKEAWIFDQPHYLKHIEARGALIRRLVPDLKASLGLSTALDAGCGPGFFAKILTECGLEVRGFDAREVNIDQARRRYPNVSFEVQNLEESSVTKLGTSDLVLCFGLLYHLESPLRAIRHLRALTGKVLLLESMCIPAEGTVVQLREEPASDDQSLTDLAFYPSEECIVKMMYHAGFSHVYRSKLQPDHQDFRETAEYARHRTVLIASNEPLDLPWLTRALENRESRDPWTKTNEMSRARHFAKKPLREKLRSIRFRAASFKSHWRERVRTIPMPIRLPFGAWWIFEKSELAFVEGYIKPGMTVLDLGAHHGLYTLLASKRVGASGRVFAFEPSQRERKSLSQHLFLNHCHNVAVESLALGKENAKVDLYVVEEWAAGCNSLKPPDVPAKTSRTPVQVRRLDDWLNEHKVGKVDFVKLDVEGAELDALRGAEDFLTRVPRPVILAEIQDIRTAPWGYRAKEIIELLSQKRFRWFSITQAGTLQELDITAESFDGNFVAIPEERECAETLTATATQ